MKPLLHIPLLLFTFHLSLAQTHTPYGSKASYELVGGNVLDYQFPCTPVAVFSVHRHGTRNIGKKIVQKIDLLVGTLQSHYMSQGLPSNDLAWLLDFGHRHKPNKDLILEGYRQLFDQGQRFKQAFPDLFSSTDDVRVGTSYKGRCISSALSFLHGVYGDSFRVKNESSILNTKDIRRDCTGMCHVYNPVTQVKEAEPHIWFEHQQNHLLRYYKDCRRYVTKESNKIVWQAGPNKYLHGPHMVELTNKMSERVGLELSPHDVVTLHLLCAMEVAVPRLMNNSRFCSLFQNKELYVTAFYLDMMRYYGKMVPEAVNSSCVLLQDGLSFLKDNRGVSLKFAHTETIFPLLEHIGYLTQPMTDMRNLLDREFFGDITPLGSNFFMVAMECPHSNDRIVQAFLNEKPIEMPNCGNPCKLNKILELFPASSCDFVAVCEGTSLYNSINIEIIALAVVAIVLVDLVRRRFVF